MTLLDNSTWEGRIFSGEWINGSGEAYDAVEPATGKTLGSVGTATPADVDDAVKRAVRAQREWAARPYSDRAAVLRRAARLFEEHQQEIETWLVRESGAIRPFAAMQVGSGGAEECHEAAALAGAPYGELLRSGQQRLSFARRVPVGWSVSSPRSTCRSSWPCGRSPRRSRSATRSSSSRTPAPRSAQAWSSPASSRRRVCPRLELIHGTWPKSPDACSFRKTPAAVSDSLMPSPRPA